MRLYIDGDLKMTSPSYPGTADSWNAGTGYIGRISALTYSHNGSLCAPFILNRCMSSDEISDYYKLARSALWKTDYGCTVSVANEGGVVGQYISNTPFQCADATGRWQVETDTINGKSTKVLTCKTAGTVYIDKSVLQSEAGALAFGEWEWYYYRTGAAITHFAFISSAKTLTSYNGYEIYTQGTGIMYILRYDAGAIGSYMAYTTAAQAPLNVWTKFNVKRSVAGAFTFYINDAIPPLAAGTDPVTDTTYLSGNYLTISAQVGDKLVLGAIDGSNALVKRLKA
jgi:hypothetical protein